MKKESNIFIFSKPLQYFNLRNIAIQDNHHKILIVEPNFANAEPVVQTIREQDKYWDEVIVVSSGFELFRTLRKFKLMKVFYYLDCFIIPSTIFYFSSIKELYIYEEGYGSYRRNIFHKLPFYKKWVRKLLQAPDYPGQHPHVKGIYLYCPDYYRKAFNAIKPNQSILTFKAPFQQMLANSTGLAKRIFGNTGVEEIRHKEVALYITSWTINQEFLTEILRDQRFDHILIKPHPHIQQHLLEVKDPRIIILQTSIMVEFIINDLMQNGNLLYIYHDNSSSVLYFSDKSRLSIENIGSKNVEFDAILNGIRENC